MDIVNLLIVFCLIALTGFFVASEFAIVKIRASRIDQLVLEGNKQALAVRQILSNLDGYLSANQLGITITSLGLGWLGEETVAHLLKPLFVAIGVAGSAERILSFIISFSVITFFHVVVGELAPKTLAIQKAEQISLLTARPLILFYKVMYPFIFVLNGSARAIVGLFGLKSASGHEIAHTEEELRLILSESYQSGEINQSEFKYVSNIFTFDDRVAKEIMVPRTEIVAFELGQPVGETLAIVREEQYTRYPVYEGDKDHIIGLINIKEVFTDLMTSPHERKPMKHYIRPVLQVIETIPIHELLLKMQRERIHMAVLVDEYGGTRGLVTVEDILEEIVGEIRDEFDADETPTIQKINEDTLLLDAKMLIAEVNDLFQTSISDEDVDTIGGWMLTEKYDIQEGETLQVDHFVFTVKVMDGHQIKQIEVVKLPHDEQEEEDEFA